DFSLLGAGTGPDQANPAPGSFWTTMHTWTIISGPTTGLPSLTMSQFAAGKFALKSGSLLLTFTPVPEPALALAVLGVGAAVATWRRRRRGNAGCPHGGPDARR